VLGGRFRPGAPIRNVSAGGRPIAGGSGGGECAQVGGYFHTHGEGTSNQASDR
jgi:hypothetical protein